MTEQQETPTPEVEEPAEEKPPFSKTQNALEDFGAEVEKQVRTTIGSVVGAKPEDDWETVGRLYEANVRGFIAGIFDAKPTEDQEDVSWDDIGSTVDNQLRKTVGGWAGAEEEDDWSDIGPKIDKKIRAWFSDAFGVSQKTSVEAEVEAGPVEAEAEVEIESEEAASWSDIGETIEQNIRSNIGNWVDADPDASWETIGDRFAERFRTVFGNVRDVADNPPDVKVKVSIDDEEVTSETEDTE